MIPLGSSAPDLLSTIIWVRVAATALFDRQPAVLVRRGLHLPGGTNRHRRTLPLNRSAVDLGTRLHQRRLVKPSVEHFYADGALVDGPLPCPTHQALRVRCGSNERAAVRAFTNTGLPHIHCYRVCRRYIAPLPPDVAYLYRGHYLYTYTSSVYTAPLPAVAISRLTHISRYSLRAHGTHLAFIRGLHLLILPFPLHGR